MERRGEREREMEGRRVSKYISYFIRCAYDGRTIYKYLISISQISHVMRCARRNLILLKTRAEYAME